MVADRFSPLPPGAVRFTKGLLADRFDVNEKVRLLHVDEEDLLDCFERRDAPHQDWQGEHVGKFLHAATLAWQSTGDEALHRKIVRVADRLMRTQEPDGYLGAYPNSKRWTSWDVWVHKYVLLGLLTYHQYTGDPRALTACKRIGDLLVRTFGTGPGQKDINLAGEHEGLAATSVLEPMVILYRATKDPHYLDFAHYIVENYDAPSGPALLSGLERTHSVFGPKSQKAYEMTSNLSGLLELYRATGQKRLLDDALLAWQDIADNRLYITGAGSMHEFWSKDGEFPSTVEAQVGETCVTVTWEQFNTHLLRLQGDAKFADRIEWTVYNHLFAAQKPTGEAWCYFTPLEGQKPYSPQTTCCLSSGPRGVALLTSLATMTSSDGGVVENLFYQGSARISLPKGEVEIDQRTDYPASGRVEFQVHLSQNTLDFPLRLRIPAWAASAKISVNGRPIEPPVIAGYAVLNRTWRDNDEVVLELPMSVKTVARDGKIAFEYGPMVLALDTQLNPHVSNPSQLSLPAGGQPTPTAVTAPSGDLRFDMGGYHLRPFAFAGQDGGSYSVWFDR